MIDIMYELYLWSEAMLVLTPIVITIDAFGSKTQHDRLNRKFNPQIFRRIRYSMCLDCEERNTIEMQR